MLDLNQNSIKLNASALDKTDAIRQVGALLVESGHMQPDYITSMMQREKVANTYLGNGIAIPHGLPQDRDLIKTTGIAVLQLPKGVEWNAGERVQIVVGIAAKSDEHIEILTNLTHVLGDEAAVQQMAQTADPADIIERLTNRRPVASSDHAPDFAKAIDLVIPGKAGLHARPATLLVTLAKPFESQIRLRYGDQTADAKSLISLLRLGVAGGQTVRLMAEGIDADQALQTLSNAIKAGLEDEEESAPVRSGRSLALESLTVPGIAASPGLAIAPIYQLKRSKLVFETAAKDPAAEEVKLRQALAAAKLQLQDLYEAVKEKAGQSKASIFQAHQEFLNDPELLQDAVVALPDHSAAWAWQQVIRAAG